jgi:hypothetical protein
MKLTHTQSSAVLERSTSRRALLGGAALSLPFLAHAASASAAVDEGTLAQYPADSSRNVLEPQSASVVPLTIKSAAGQSANLLELKDDSGRVITSIDPSGRIARYVDSTHGPMVWELGASEFAGTTDPTSYFGYNVGAGGNPIVSGEPYGAYVMEGDYNNGTKRTMEQYLELRSANNQVNVRPLFFQVDRNATQPEDFLTIAEIVGNPLRIATMKNGAGNFIRSQVVMAQFGQNDTRINSVRSGDNVLRIAGGIGANSRISMGVNGQDDIFLISTASTNRAELQLNSTAVLRLHTYSGGQGISVGTSDNSGAGVFVASGGAQRAVIGRARPGQTANLLEIQGSDQTVLGGFSKTGHSFTTRNSPPPDGDISPNTATFWFDPSPGASKFSVKARRANGQIVTGSIDLTPGP